MLNQMREYLSENGLISEYQSGYRQGHSCSTAVLKVMEDIRPFFDRGDLTILTLLDFSKAFDTVCHKILLQKLFAYFGFSQDAVGLVASYLTNRRQKVLSNNNCSGLVPIKAGVPQGSILGPILFSMYINDIVRCCKNVSIHLYADDAQIYLSAPLGLSEDLVFRINEDLESIFLWSKYNKLNLNASKTQAIVLSHGSFSMEDVSPLVLNGTIIKYETSLRTLGFKLNTSLTCVDHVNSTICKSYGVLRQLWKSAAYIPQDVKLKLVKTLLVPIISYQELVYGCPDKGSLSKLQLLINNAARYVHSKRKFDHISELSMQILGCSLSKFLISVYCYSYTS